MREATPAYWLLVAATLAALAAIMGWSLPLIRTEAGGLQPFDLRPAGYGLAEARAFLAALSPAGLAQYAGPQAILDAIYPPLLFATLAIAFWHLSQGMRQVTRVALLVVAAIGMAADGFENAEVRDMLAAGAAGLTEEMVASASRLTVIKSAANGASFIALGVLLVRQRIIGRGKGAA